MATVATHYGLYGSVFEGNLILSENGQRGLIDTYNYFLGLNMGDSPMAMLRAAMAVGAIGIIIGSLAIPVLAAVTHWINTKLMPQPESNSKNADDPAAAMAQSMKTMNIMMPIMSAWFCLTLPSGMGLYWIAGSVVRSIQQIIVNKHLDKMDFDEIIKKNSVKSAKKLEKMKENQERMNAYAEMKTRNIQSKAKTDVSQKSSAPASSTGSTSSTGKSMRDKANMVNRFNQKNNDN